jgi:hypothetical protein
VDSRATVSLVTKAFSEIRADAKVGRSEALRRSMLALIDSGGRDAHPTSWAPFVVVGEGARYPLCPYPQSAVFAMGKFAPRVLAQSMARELAPKGIHVAHFVIYGSVRNAEKGRVKAGNMTADSYLDPEAIAQSYLHVVQQPRSAWTREVELRPWVERFCDRRSRCARLYARRGGCAHLFLHVEDRRQPPRHLRSQIAASRADFAAARKAMEALALRSARPRMRLLPERTYQC